MPVFPDHALSTNMAIVCLMRSAGALPSPFKAHKRVRDSPLTHPRHGRGSEWTDQKIKQVLLLELGNIFLFGLGDNAGAIILVYIAIKFIRQDAIYGHRFRQHFLIS